MRICRECGEDEGIGSDGYCWRCSPKPKPSIPVKYYDGKAGRYLCQCYHCKAQFWGDKRDIVCPSCETPPPMAA